jgi:hypothetical protein
MLIGECSNCTLTRFARFREHRCDKNKCTKREIKHATTILESVLLYILHQNVNVSRNTAHCTPTKRNPNDPSEAFMFHHHQQHNHNE